MVIHLARFFPARHEFFHLIAISVLWWALAVPTPAQVAPASWQGTARDAGGKVIPRAQVELRATKSDRLLTTTDEQGAFRFPELPPGDYAVTLHWHNKKTRSRELLKIRRGNHLISSVQVAGAGEWLVLQTTTAGEHAPASGGEKLSSRQVSELPLNKRDGALGGKQKAEGRRQKAGTTYSSF